MSGSKNSTHLDQWRSAALAVASDDLPAIGVPIHVFLGEAVDAARFVKEHWKPQLDEKKRVVRRGLDSAAGGKSRLHPKIGQDILSLQHAAQEANTAYLLAVDPAAHADPMARGRFLLDEITATLEWLFDDGVEDEKDAQLDNLGAAHADDPESADALAGALDDYAGLAEPHRAEMDGLGDFEAAYVDEARTVAEALRNKPAVPAPMSPKARAALALRNKVIALLAERVAIVRAAARFVFRGQPSIARLATSAYERRRRAASRRARAKQAAGAAKPAADANPAGAAKPAGAQLEPTG